MAIRAQRARDHRPRVLDQPAGLASFRMDRRGIAAQAPGRGHRLAGLLAQRRGRIPVEINPVARHGGSTLVAAICEKWTIRSHYPMAIYRNWRSKPSAAM